MKPTDFLMALRDVWKGPEPADSDAHYERATKYMDLVSKLEAEATAIEKPPCPEAQDTF